MQFAILRRYRLFSAVREKGRQTVCLSNLHQLGLAVSLYIITAKRLRTGGEAVCPGR